MVGINELETRHRRIGRNQGRLLWIQQCGVPVDGVGHGGKLVPQTDVHGELARDLPFIQHEEPVAPLGHEAAHLRTGGCVVLDQSEHEVGRRVPGILAGEVEDSARAVHGGAARLQLPEFRARHDGVRALRPTDLIGCLPGQVVLEPVGAAVAEARKARDVEIGNAGIVKPDVSIEARDTELRSRVFEPVHVEVVQRGGIEVLAPDAELVYQGGLQRVGIADAEVVARHRSRARAGRIRGAGQQVHRLPLVTEIQPDSVAQVLIDPVDRLVRIVVIRQTRGEIVLVARQGWCRVVLPQFLRRGRQSRRRNDVAGELLVSIKRVFHRGRCLREIARPHLRRDQRADEGRLPDLPQSLVGAHEECLVAAVIQARDEDRPVQPEPELVLAQGGLFRGGTQEEGARVQLVVAQKLDQISVQHVRA